jgi:hypothetical protein
MRRSLSFATRYSRPPRLGFLSAGYGMNLFLNSSFLWVSGRTERLLPRISAAIFKEKIK